MTTKDYLKQIARFESMIERKQNEVHRLDIMAHSVKSPSFGEDKVQSSMVGDKMSLAVAKLIDAEKEVSNTLDLYIQKRKYIIGQIDNIPDRISYTILIDKYVEQKRYCEIACKLNCTERWVKKQHSKALKDFETLYGEEYLDNPTIFS